MKAPPSSSKPPSGSARRQTLDRNRNFSDRPPPEYDYDPGKQSPFDDPTRNRLQAVSDFLRQDEVQRNQRPAFNYGNQDKAMATHGLRQDEKQRNQRPAFNYDSQDKAMATHGDSDPMASATENMVEVKVVFINLLGINTVNQNFEAEIYIQARWTEVQFAGYSEEELQEVEFQNCWDPQLTIINKAAPLVSERASMLLSYEPDRVYPVLTYMWHVHGVFRETMELQHFPFDVQEISIALSSERSTQELELVCDYSNISHVSLRAAQGMAEWTAFRHVEFSQDYNTLETSSSTKHSILIASAHVKRKLGVYFWNFFLIVLLIMGMSFCILCYGPTKDGRLAITVTLFLTCVAFKLVVKATLPNISYLTYLDIYAVFALIFLALQAFENSFMIHLGKFRNKTSVNSYDKIAYGLLGALLVIFHLAFTIHIRISAFSRRREMHTKELNYELAKINIQQKQDEAEKKAFETAHERQNMPRQSMTGDNQRLNQPRQSVTGDNPRLNQPRQSMTGGSQRLNQPRQSMIGGSQRLNQPRQSMTGDNQRLNQPRQSMTGDNQRLNQPRQSMNGDSQRLNQPRQSMTGDNQRLNQSRQSVTGDNQRLNQPRQSMTGDSQRLNQPRQGSMRGDDRETIEADKPLLWGI